MPRSTGHVRSNFAFLKGTYLDLENLNPQLKDKTAILQSGEKPEWVLAQFDDTALPEAYGWWLLRTVDFDIIIPSD